MRRFKIVLKEHMTLEIATEIATLLRNKIGKPVWLDVLHDKHATFGYNGYDCDQQLLSDVMTDVFIIFKAESVYYWK